MAIPKLNFSKTYVQDEHQRTLQNIVDTVQNNTARTPYTEHRLGHVYVTSTTAGQLQQCVEPQILVSGTGANSGVSARYYWTQMPFAGSVASLQVDCTASLPAPHTITLYKNSTAVSSSVVSVGANAQMGLRTYAKNVIPFKAGDTFYAVVTFPVAVSSTFYCGFVKMYTSLGV